MKTLFFPNDLINENDINQAALLLKQGQIVAFPTETVYGLGALIDNDQALMDICKLKGRQDSKALTVHLSNIDDVFLVAENIPDCFYKIADKFFPGPLTVLLKKKNTVSSLVSKNDKVGIRIPSCDIALKLIEKVGAPIVGTSANLSSSLPLTTGKDVYAFFKGKIAAVLDGGICDIGYSSTVVDLTSKEPVILREGIITLDEIMHSF